MQKEELCARLSIKEWFLFQLDPRRGGPRVVAHRLWGAKYVELILESGLGGTLDVSSASLGVSLRA